MFRYLAILWDQLDGVQEATAFEFDEVMRSATGWQCQFRANGMVVYTQTIAPSIERCYRLKDNHGVVCGKLFERRIRDDATSSEAACDDVSPTEILCSHGRSLIDRYWGRYVAFVRNPATSELLIARDPLGHQACFRTCRNGVDLFFSSLDGCPALKAVDLSINWEFLAVHMMRPFTEARETAIKEVTRVLGGECLSRDGEKYSSRIIWHPVYVAMSDPIKEVREAVDAVRSTTRVCVNTWACAYGNVLHSLSGGLDSSIVASFLGSAPGNLTVNCLNYRWRDDSGTDERHFARLAASWAKVPLHETEIDMDSDIKLLLPTAPHPTPYNFSLFRPLIARRRAIARSLGAVAYLDGSGGDELFFNSDSCAALADYISAHPHPAELATRTSRIASEWNMPMSAILQRSLAFLSGEPPVAQLLRVMADSMTWIDRSLVEEVTADRRFLHPWLAEDFEAPRGKVLHAISLASSLQTHLPGVPPDDPDTVQPLMSEPLVEICLRIPTYLHESDLWSRAIARRAFACDIPCEIAWRTTKGSLSTATIQFLRSNSDFLRSTVLSSDLRASPLFDVRQIEKDLADFGDVESWGYYLLYAFSTVIWLRNIKAFIGSRK